MSTCRSCGEPQIFDGHVCEKNSRAALTEGMEPVAWMYENQNVKDKWYLVWSEPSELGFNRKPLYSAEALAAAVLAEREACIKVCENRFLEWADEEGNDEYAAGAHDCAAAIRGMK